MEGSISKSNDDGDIKSKKKKEKEKEKEKENENENNSSNSHEIDSSGGAIVWVRRRNGSWWPGRVLAPQELPESLLKLPRSGTPIKLLGRQDGSMDWYNLEKSRRVKAFRCGEYDECIQKAKEHALKSKRKQSNTGKYVRREEAILHALELEEAHSLPGKNNIVSENILSTLITDEISNPQLNKNKKSKKKTPNDSEDDTNKGMKRMKDLQDLGLKITKGDESDNDNYVSDETPLSSSRDSCSSLKRKQPNASDSLKKKCRSKLLAEVSMGAKKVKTLPTPNQGDITGGSSPKGITNIESTLNKTDSLDDSPNISGTSCEEALVNTHEFQSETNDNVFPNILESIDDDIPDVFANVPSMEGDVAADVSPTLEESPSTDMNTSTEEKQSNHCINVNPVSQLNEGVGEACSTSSSTKFTSINQNFDMGTSEWHTKGKKRNIRYGNVNRNVDLDSIVNKSSLKEMTNSISDESLTSDISCQQVKCMSISEICDVNEDQKLKISLMNNGIENGVHISLPPRKIRLPSRYRDSEQNSSHLYDVEIIVKSNYQGQRVPLVSLMSKYNNKPIVGHPVSIEVLRSGSSCFKKPSSGKRSSFSPRKIRKLSSISTDRKKQKENVRNLAVDKVGFVSCIPLKLVFSRLNEALKN